jgi:hypothetical protein
MPGDRGKDRSARRQRSIWTRCRFRRGSLVRPTVKFRGKLFQLPPELPWEVVEGMSSASIDATGSTRALKAMFGTAAGGEGEDEEQSGYQRFLALKPSLTDIKNLFDHVLGLYDAELGESSASGAS